MTAKPSGPWWRSDLSDHAAVTVTLDTTLIDPAQIPPWY